MRTLSPTGLKSLLAQETGEVWTTLVTIDHPALSEPVRVCSDSQNVVSRGHVFVAFPFELQLPEDSANGPPRASLSIDNVSQEISVVLQSIPSPPSVRLEVVRAADPDVLEVVLPVFELRNARYNAQVVQGELVVEDLTGEPYPADDFTPAYFRGLFQ